MNLYLRTNHKLNPIGDIFGIYFVERGEMILVQVPALSHCLEIDKIFVGTRKERNMLLDELFQKR